MRTGCGAGEVTRRYPKQLRQHFLAQKREVPSILQAAITLAHSCMALVIFHSHSPNPPQQSLLFCATVRDFCCFTSPPSRPGAPAQHPRCRPAASLQHSRRSQEPQGFSGTQRRPAAPRHPPAIAPAPSPRALRPFPPSTTLRQQRSAAKAQLFGATHAESRSACPFDSLPVSYLWQRAPVHAKAWPGKRHASDLSAKLAGIEITIRPCFPVVRYSLPSPSPPMGPA
jgi:hypothetical protein